MSGMHPMGGRWLRTDRSAVNTKLTRQTLGRIVRFARPHRALITMFLLVTVLDAAIGLATLVVPREELDATVTDLAQAILANARDAVSGTKALLQQAAGRSLDDQRRAERVAQVGLMRALAAQF